MTTMKTEKQKKCLMESFISLLIPSLQKSGIMPVK